MGCEMLTVTFLIFFTDGNQRKSIKADTQWKSKKHFFNVAKVVIRKDKYIYHGMGGRRRKGRSEGRQSLLLLRMVGD